MASLKFYLFIFSDLALRKIGPRIIGRVEPLIEPVIDVR